MDHAALTAGHPQDVAQLFRLLADTTPVDPGRGPATSDVVVADDGTQLTLASATGPVALHVDPELREQLAQVAAAGRWATATLAALSSHDRDHAEEQRAARRAAATVRYTDPTPDLFGLEAAARGWTLPGDPRGLVVHPVPVPEPRWSSIPYVAALDVAYDSTTIGHVYVDADENVTVRGGHAFTHLGDTVVGRKDLVATNPWHDWHPEPGPGPVPDQVTRVLGAFADVADDVIDWVRCMDVAAVETEHEVERRDAERVEWARLSRAKDRIPNKALNDWLRDASHIDYDASGLRIGGWKAHPVTLVGRTRPRHLDGHGRRSKPVGVAEIRYVIRVEQRDAYGHARRAHLAFTEREIDALRDALPGCVVAAPEDRKAVFVAVDAPQYRAAMDAALAEWVLLDGNV